jgi:hypothetical protein
MKRGNRTNGLIEPPLICSTLLLTFWFKNVDLLFFLLGSAGIAHFSQSPHLNQKVKSKVEQVRVVHFSVDELSWALPRFRSK